MTTFTTLRGKRAWVKIPKPTVSARLRLFCFPYAGARSPIFHSWVGAFSSNIEVCPVLLPGEDFQEQCGTSVEELVPMLGEGLRSYFDRPFAFFGYSMGTIIAFELLRWIQRELGISAVHLFVAARRAPGVPSSKAPTYALPQPELLAELKLLNGTPAEIIENPELLELFLPRIRADLQLNETYCYQPGGPLWCPITAYGGTEDHDTAPQELMEWRSYTNAGFNFKIFSGDHFFMHSQLAELLANISSSLGAHA